MNPPGSANSPPGARAKPLLRGWSHALATLGAIALTFALCLRTLDDPPRFLSMVIYGLSMVELFAVSAIYHIGTWEPWTRRKLRAMDHASIFVLIAGTYTPLCFNVLGGWLRVTSLVVIWLLAATGVALSAFTTRLPRWVGTGIYIGMGWASILALPSLLAALPPEAVWLLFLGGVAYTLGGVIYALKKPDPAPNVLGFHEIFHLLVIAGATIHAVVVWSWIVPFPRS
ncbi:MAG TPA: hemolysin III family protein [Chloroflexia bacterium]|nr:hemolysin III family protein [Chloroflexia bacterium]